MSMSGFRRESLYGGLGEPVRGRMPLLLTMDPRPGWSRLGFLVVLAVAALAATLVAVSGIC